MILKSHMTDNSKNISLSNQTVKRLLRVADSFDETAESVITRLLDFFEQYQNTSVRRAEIGSLKAAVWSPFNPPNLRHTKVTAASIGGQDITVPSWNKLVDEAVRRTRKSLGSFAGLKKVIPANVVEGVKQDHGYRYLSDVHLSLQGQDAQDAWRCVAHLARSQGFAVEVHFLWRNKPDAAYPGQLGNLTISGGV